MSRTEHSEPSEVANHPRGVVHVHDGPSFVLPPRDRLFCAFHRRKDGMAAIRELLNDEPVRVDDVWLFEGERGAGRIDPSLVTHGVRTVMARSVQRLLTGDAEYGDRLVAELRSGSLVLALHVSLGDVDEVVPVLERHGGHFIAVGRHWNYMSVDGPTDAADRTASHP